MLLNYPPSLDLASISLALPLLLTVPLFLSQQQPVRHKVLRLSALLLLRIQMNVEPGRPPPPLYCVCPDK